MTSLRPKTFTSLCVACVLLGGLLFVSSASGQAVDTPPPTPQGKCGPGSRPETDLQGRVPPADHASGRAAEGYTCNTEQVGFFGTETVSGTVGGFKVLRYVDASGNDCAYYDTTLIFPTNAFDAQSGVNVLDMSDPTNPTLTAQLVTGAMQSPHESLVLSEERGILAAVVGNPGLAPGLLDLYDISQDCRDPQLIVSSPAGIIGHESGMAPDGMTFYSASPATSLVAVDISNPQLPVPLWGANIQSHGVSVSDDGNRVYVSALSGLIILDTTEVQSRVPNPTVTEIARLDWPTRNIPQNSTPITIDGHPYLVENDEFGGGTKVGAARIIDIEDETNPFVLSDMRLEVHQPENFAEIASDPGTSNPIQRYAAHYCAVPTRVDPTIVACSMILSGLRVFDISDPANPVEVAYFNAPSRAQTQEGNYAMSAPAFVPERNEIWYSDGFSGFYAVRVTNDVWPQAATVAPAPAEAAVTTTIAPAPVVPQPESLPATGRDSTVAWIVAAVLTALVAGRTLVRRRPQLD